MADKINEATEQLRPPLQFLCHIHIHIYATRQKVRFSDIVLYNHGNGNKMNANTRMCINVNY